MSIDDLLHCMKIIGNEEVQRNQLMHRLDLVNAFSVEPGMNVLEIGCGQGDTTVALASAVGEDGHVTAIDLAEADYGAPITLGKATNTILKSKLGKRIDFYLSTEFLEFPEEKFDIVVLSHCSWYFQSPEQLRLYLEKVYRMTERVCIAEWDVSEFTLEQHAHLNAVQILALHSEFVENDGNIQHIFSKDQLKKMLKTAGWKITQEQTVDAHYLQDGKWETAYAESIREVFDKTSTRIQVLTNTLYEQLKNKNAQSLNSVVLIGDK